MKKFFRGLILGIAALFGYAPSGGVSSDLNPANRCKSCGTAELAKTWLAKQGVDQAHCPECGRLVRK